MSAPDQQFDFGGLIENEAFGSGRSGSGPPDIPDKRYITAMRKTLLITLIAFASALGALSSSAHSAARSTQGECCEEVCHDMPACANLIFCQACLTTVASLPPTEGLASAYRPAFPTFDQDRVYKGAAWPIWTPPD